ncbi:putative bifunctional diguanylate cyclase/phosphodiesterase [Shinella granuli]|uniref:EAL domain-containing protein (Putative c-di-GMP-specific phosphodiesterase class I) n=1 Tax=Shinella granuli TaxID=323621 RepID=A0A4R2D490_SHIGR|nr:EAL domain-containing protein [Shinella granuli]TCN48701.1 EAL domain-containing protein (putative c-di-GMP-specific phosphodiesterase class I) [Shinella granuli]
MRHTDDYSDRFRLVYATASLAAGVLTAGWGVVFAAMQEWSMVAMDIALVTVAVASFVLVRRRQLTAAILFSQVAFLVIIAAFCLLFDVPNDVAPRVSHLFLLVLAMIGYINYQQRPSRRQMAIVALSLAAFVVFASTQLALPFARPISDDFRFVGAWVNVTIAVAMLCGCLYMMRQEFARNLGRERDIAAALKNREFELFYQPQVDQAGAVTGAEALLRWRRPDGSFVSPGDFIPIAEQAGLMPAIGDWVLNEALKTLSFWQQDDGTRHLRLAVNVSADQFMKADFADAVLARIRAQDIDPARLKLELTESMMANDVDAIAEKMGVLRAAGLTLSLDDFGTGYSSLSHLRRLPIQEIKIDRSFVKDAPESKRNRLLLKSIFDIARTLDLAVVAEGIETKEQFLLLQSFGGMAFQGFYFGRPVPLADFQTQWAAETPPPLAETA